MLLVATGVLTTGYGKPQPARRIPRPPPLRREGSGRKRRGSSRARPAAGREGKGKTWQVILLNRGLEDVDGNGWKTVGKLMENGWKTGGKWLCAAIPDSQTLPAQRE